MKQNISARQSLPDRYWATLEYDELAPELVRRCDEFAQYLLTTGRADRMRRSYCLTYGLDPDSKRESSRTSVGGDQGEQIEMRANMVRKLAEAIHVLVTGTRPAWTASVGSLDSSAADALPIVDGVLDHALVRRGAEAAAARAVWYALLFTEGWTSVRWDEQTGPATGVLSGEPEAMGDGADPMPALKGSSLEMLEQDQAEPPRVTYLGDVQVLAHRPDCVVRDVGLDESTENDWIILATQMNRWTLAELYPSKREEIVRTTSRNELDGLRDQIFYGAKETEYQSSQDQITVYEFFHRSTPALPMGRYSLLVGDCIVADGENKYGDIPVYSMIPDTEPCSPCGYSSNYDLMGIQQALDSAFSSFVSTVENLGQPAMWAGANNSGVGVDVIGGFNFINSPAKPEPVPFLDPSSLAILSSAIAEMASMMTQLSGLPPTALGDASGTPSGDALEMMHSIAVQSTSRVQGSYSMMFAAAMLGVIRRYRTFATTERIVSVTGKGNKKRAQRWTGADLAAIDAITVEMRAAVTRTASGRQQLADKWLTQGLVKTPQEYMEVATTGALTPLTEKPLSERALIERENEGFVDGQPSKVAPTHNHPAHMNEHSVLLLDPDVLNDPMAYQVIADHIMEHAQVWGMITMAQPDLLFALGIPPSPSAQMAMQPPGTDPNAPGGAQPAGEPGAPKPKAEKQPPDQNPRAAAAASNVPSGTADPSITAQGQSPEGNAEPVMA